MPLSQALAQRLEGFKGAGGASEPPAVVLVAAIGFDYKSAIPLGKDFMSFLDRLKDPRSAFDR